VHGTDLIVIAVPVFNDWESARALIRELGELAGTSPYRFEVLLIDDGSTVQPGADLAAGRGAAIQAVRLLRLRRNLGHQRAIAIGLAHIQDSIPCSGVVVMDADGEDNPRDVLRLLEEFDRQGREKIVFARRDRRSEGPLFRVFYAAYQLLHVLLTGTRLPVGNFSVLPFASVQQLVAVSEIWNHFAAAVLKERLPVVFLGTERGRRRLGDTKMSFGRLVIHGLSAIAVNREMLGVRALVLCVALGLALLAGVSVIVAIRLGTDLAIPGWASYMVGLFSILFLQAVATSLLFVFMVLSGRDNYSFLPIRDCPYFVKGEERLP